MIFIATKKNSKDKSKSDTKSPKTPTPKITCCCCGKSNFDYYFYKSQSKLYQGNGGRIPLCKTCLNSLYESYFVEFGKSQFDAMKRVCMKADIYFDIKTFESTCANSSNATFVGNYIKNLNVGKVNFQKSYDDTILDEMKSGVITSIQDVEETADDEEVSTETIKRWGVGYTPDEYRWLDDEYSSWVIKANNGDTPSKSLDGILKQLCLVQVDIQRARSSSARQKEVKGYVELYQQLLQSAGLKPIQEDSSSIAEKNALGVLIDVWENTEPVPEPAPEFRDVDNIRHYIKVWFTGHLSRMFGLKIDPETKQEYEDEIEKYKVKPPEYEDVQIDDMGGSDG